MEKNDSKLTKTRQKKIFFLVFIYRQRLLLAAVCMIMVAAANGVMALLVKPVMDDIFIRQNMEMLLLIPGFAYNGMKSPALKVINLKVSPGDVLTLVGMSGGGKTSLVNLVPRLYDVFCGRVLIAHRLSTIDYASRIILLKNGSINEQGTHEELMA